MRCGSPLTIWLALAAAVLAPPAAIEHIAPAPDDRFLECASKLLRKPTIRSAAIPWISVRVPCGANRNAFNTALADQELQVSDAGNWFVIHHAKTTSTAAVLGDRRYKWRTLQVVRVVEHQPSPLSGLPLTDEQVQVIGASVESVARPVPASISPEATSGELLQLSLRVTMDRVRLRPDVDSVVTLIGFERTGRLVYGELRSGSYVPLWDSPLLASVGGPNLSWTYRDLDGDGVLEILAYGAANPYYETLMVFDLMGNELTRNGECYDIYGLSNTNPTCPMIGETIRFEPSSPNRPFPLEIVTETRDGNERFCLKLGRYVPCGKPDR